MTGKIMKGIAGFYYVDVEESGIYECKAKGIFRKEGQKPLVGDLVEIEILDEAEKTGNMTRILPRKNELIRPAVANIDQALVIFALENPTPNLTLLDRFLVMMEQQNVPTAICFNKRDLAGEDYTDHLRSVYENCGYRVFTVSAAKEQGMQEVEAYLKGKTTVVAGPSGVGKSSITNRMQKEIQMETGEISKKLKKGKHTTRHSQMIPIDHETYLCDTPGFSSLYTTDMEKEELKNFFPEFHPYEGKCRFLGCIHGKEPGCAVKEALEQGNISKERFENYTMFYEELKEQEIVKEISDNEITTGNLKDDFYYMEGELENTSNKLVYLIPQEIFLKENRKILQRILEMLLLVIGFTVCTMLYFSKRIAKPLVEVAQTLEKAPNGMAVLEEPQGSFQEMSKFVFCYNQAGKKIEELLGNVERESRLKEKAHYEMLMSQISPHFIFNTVNSIRIMAIKEGQNREGGNENTEKALEALGDILHAVYSNKNGMTTVGQETALLKSYVDIMQMRFGSSFQYYNVIPTELFYYEIPAFTMQPIVENAILHGVKGVTAGQIIVSAIEYENEFVISVFNNGNSADKKKIEDLLKGEKNQRAVTGIGLYNVNSRLKLLYGESYGLIYNEKVRNGFEIWVRLPKKITDSEER